MIPYNPCDTFEPRGVLFPDGQLGYIYSEYKINGFVTVALVVRKHSSCVPLSFCNEVAHTFDDALQGASEALQGTKYVSIQSA